MDRSNHYERAFEAYLQENGVGYVAVDETRRTILGDTPVKSLDFIVCGSEGGRFVVDVKGRRFPGGKPEKRRRVWECWSAKEDVESLQTWAELLGCDYRGLLVFAYHILPEIELPEDTEDLWVWQARRYLLRAIPVGEYRLHMRVRSPSWGTVTLPSQTFRTLARPVREYVATVPALEECPF